MSHEATLGTILIIDDDSNIRELLSFNLSSEGFEVKALEYASKVTPELIRGSRMVIVDAMKQSFSGLDLCKMIKADSVTERIPVIICTDREGDDSIIDAFDAGAEDYISKPFSLRELIARVKAILRRHPLKEQASAFATPTNNILSIPGVDMQVDIDKQRVIEKGQVVPLTKTEYAILVFLLRHLNTFFNRNEIFNEIWKDEEDAGMNVRVVDTNISRLRKKLGESGRYIINRYGMGYAAVDNLVN